MRERSAFGALTDDKLVVVPSSRCKQPLGGMILSVWQENALTPKQEVEALQQMLAARERDVADMQRRLEAKQGLQEELAREHEVLRKEHLAVQLELKVAHETSWTAEEEMQSLRAKLAAREREVLSMMHKIASKEGVIMQLRNKCEHERHHTGKGEALGGCARGRLAADMLSCLAVVLSYLQTYRWRASTKTWQSFGRLMSETAFMLKVPTWVCRRVKEAVRQAQGTLRWRCWQGWAANGQQHVLFSRISL